MQLFIEEPGGNILVILSKGEFLDFARNDAS
jgi:hypothetical protein